FAAIRALAVARSLAALEMVQIGCITVFFAVPFDFACHGFGPSSLLHSRRIVIKPSIRRFVGGFRCLALAGRPGLGSTPRTAARPGPHGDHAVIRASTHHAGRSASESTPPLGSGAGSYTASAYSPSASRSARCEDSRSHQRPRHWEPASCTRNGAAFISTSLW